LGAFAVLAECNLVTSALFDQPRDYMLRFINVPDGPITESVGKSIIFFARHIIARLVEQFQGSVITAGRLQVGVGRRDEKCLCRRRSLPS
jgi:hypothetical protein